MSPIPINASMGMLISLAIAFIITPWLAAKILKAHGGHGADEQTGESRSYRFFARLVGPFLKGRGKRYGLVLALLVLVGASASLGVVQAVILKMLPFDNKSEFQVVVDMPEGTSLEATAGVLSNIGKVLDEVPEIVDYQIYAGTASPVGFNGLVRQYYLRQSAQYGDIQVNLVDGHERERKSHQIAIDVRQQLSKRFTRSPANIKVVEVPPGPPVLSPLVAEVYGLDYERQIEAAKKIREIFEQTKDIVDIDDTIDAASDRLVILVDRQRAAALGISQSAVSTAIATAVDGEDVNFLHTGGAKYPIPIRLQLEDGEKAEIHRVLALKLRARNGTLVPLSQIVSVRRETREKSIYHKDMLPVVYVLGDMAGPLDSPLYGMGEIYSKLAGTSVTSGNAMPQFLFSQPPSPIENSVKWDGEWQITFETFRDMGIAYGVGMILIYFLIVAQFRSYLVPLIIMAPIPLKVIGVMPGHALLDAKFTATSMIGMIALAGIIVRNSILLVDFINQQIEEGEEIFVAVINSSAVRAKPKF